MTWSITGKQVTAASGNVVRFDYDVREATEVNNVLIVILEVPLGQVMTENVFGISPSGKLLWQIERTAANSTDPANRYLGLTSHGEDIAYIYNWNGVNSGVDVNTGKVLNVRIVK